MGKLKGSMGLVSYTMLLPLGAWRDHLTGRKIVSPLNSPLVQKCGVNLLVCGDGSIHHLTTPRTLVLPCRHSMAFPLHPFRHARSHPQISQRRTNHKSG